MDDHQPHHKRSSFTRLRNYFFTGFIITAPLFLTGYMTWAIVEWVDSWVKPYIPAVYNPDTYLPFRLPGFGLIFALAVITAIGFLAANYVGRSIIGYGEYLLGRMPLVRNVYSGLKQIFQTVLSDQSGTFQRVCLIEYPRKDIYALAFISTDTRGEVNEILNAQGKRTLSVFLPTTPNPTSGFLLFVEKDDVIELDMSVEDAAKLVISAGLVAPETQDKLKDMADQAQKKNGEKPEGRKPETRKPEAKKPLEGITETH